MAYSIRIWDITVKDDWKELGCYFSTDFPDSQEICGYFAPLLILIEIALNITF